VCILPRLGPEKGVIHIATAAVVNALWDLFARHERKPLWRLIVDMSPEELVKVTSFRYITDVITPDEALEIFTRRQREGKEERIRRVTEEGYPSYVTSAGWFGYSCVFFCC
jgi:L-fuconate dehydratase